MQLSQANALVHIPDGASEKDALSRLTHLAIGAHQDDLEFFAYHGIAACYKNESAWFGGITLTDGAGSARSGPYSKYTDSQMKEIRRQEQNKAADVGEYSIQYQLDLPSATLKDTANTQATDDLISILQRCTPKTVYLHNPADKHDTHIATLHACIDALRALPPERRPTHVYGCEVWRDLDWLSDDRKVPLDASQHPELAAELVAVFDSQIAGGKRYDLATLGRRQANATYFDSHSVDSSTALTYALELAPLLLDDSLSIADFIVSHIDDFRADCLRRIGKFNKHS